jgi:hypothetical protein
MSTAKELTIIEKVKSDPTIIDVQNRLNEVVVIRQEIFQKGVHFGPPYKGAKNDTLLKPGATFLQQKYGLREHHERIETTIVVDKDDLSKSYIIIQDRCRIFDSNGIELAQADAACTTFEDKYLYRGFSNKVCPKCGGEFIIKGKEEYGGGWLCFKNKGGCGEKFKDNDPTIVGQDTGKKINDNPLNLLDTIVAMAQKRASVRSTIKATGVDALFSPGDGVTVDFYDDVFDGDDLTKSGEQLIQVVAKNAVISNVEAPSSDLGQETASVVVDTQSTAKTPQERLGTPSKQTIAPKSGKWPFDRNALLSALSTAAAGTSYQERGNTVKAMDAEGAFANCADLAEATRLVVARLASHRQEQPA